MSNKNYSEFLHWNLLREIPQKVYSIAKSRRVVTTIESCRKVIAPKISEDNLCLFIYSQSKLDDLFYTQRKRKFRTETTIIYGVRS